MGLRKSKMWNGFEATYWNIFQQAYNKLTNKSAVWITAYKDKATRDADVNARVPELTKMYQFSGNITTEQAYCSIKTSPEFVGATDWQ